MAAAGESEPEAAGAEAPVTEETETQPHPADRMIEPTPDTIELVRETLQGDIRDAMLGAIKEVMPTGWWKGLSEYEQGRVGGELSFQASQLAIKAVRLLAADRYPSVRIHLLGVNREKGGLKIKAEGSAATEFRHELSDAEGQFVTLVLTNIGRIDGARGEIQIDPDQPSLLDATQDGQPPV